MIRYTWGLDIPGYSRPTNAQKKLFTKLYPELVAWHKLEMSRRELENLHATNKVREQYRKSLQREDNASNRRND